MNGIHSPTESRTMLKPTVVVVAAALLAAPAWAIHKCTRPDGRVTFQDTPCAGQGEKIEVRPASGPARMAAPAAAPQPPGASDRAPTLLAPAPAAAPLPAPPAPVAVPSPLAREAQTCLDWYKPKLRDPQGAYLTEPSKDGRVLSITIHATNGYGGYVTRSGRCEFHNGKLDQDWTLIHARREGW